MFKFLLFFLFLFLISTSQCKSKKQRIELKTPNEKHREPQTEFSNTRITPEIFFKITLDIDKIAKRYQQIDSESEESIKSNLERMGKEMTKVYKKYDITEDEFNQFGEKHYRQLEAYLEDHPEIDDRLRSID